MRDKLIELLRNSGASFERALPEEIADHLLESGVIVLPFPIGTTYYRIVTKRGKVGNPYFRLIREAQLNWYNIEKVLEDYGKTVFLTRAEAEEALERMENDG